MVKRSNSAGTSDAFYFHLKSSTFSCCLVLFFFLVDKYSQSAHRTAVRRESPLSWVWPLQTRWLGATDPPKTPMKTRGALRKIRRLKTAKSRKPASRQAVSPSGSSPNQIFLLLCVFAEAMLLFAAADKISTGASVVCLRYFLMPCSQLSLLPVTSQANIQCCHLALCISLNLLSK